MIAQLQGCNLALRLYSSTVTVTEFTALLLYDSKVTVTF